jgi:hypothetical protein
MMFGLGFGLNHGIAYAVTLNRAAVMRWHKCGGNNLIRLWKVQEMGCKGVFSLIYFEVDEIGAGSKRLSLFLLVLYSGEMKFHVEGNKCNLACSLDLFWMPGEESC